VVLALVLLSSVLVLASVVLAFLPASVVSPFPLPCVVASVL
jgi:hypothetical protein